MEVVVAALRDLWRSRLAVAAVLLFSLLVGYLFGFHPGTLSSRKYEVGLASVRVLVDTPSSQVVEVAPKGSDTLGVRATLLANLMVEGVVKNTIAARAGIPASKLTGVSGSTVSDPATPDGRPGPHGYQITTSAIVNTDGSELPLIQIDAQAPDPQRAAALANASTSGLTDYLNSKAASERIAEGSRIRVTPLGLPQARDEVRGPRNALVLGAVLIVFAIGCGCILAFRRGAKLWRDADDLETMEPPDGPTGAGPTRDRRRLQEVGQGGTLQRVTAGDRAKPPARRRAAG